MLFATGIECSNPRVQHGTVRRDLLAECGHYDHWEADLGLVADLGVTYLRYGLPTHLTMRGPGQYDWSLPDLVLPRMRDMGIVPILDLLHFGLPDWLGDFQNPDFPEHFAAYAGAVADRYPWIRHWTPVNEIFVTAKLSAREGLWNEQLRDEGAFLRAVAHLAEASLLATEQIVARCQDAVIIPSESMEYVHSLGAPTPESRTFNQIRFLSLDLLYGRALDPELRGYVLDHGLPAATLERLGPDRVRPGQHVLGLDYYGHNEFLERPCGRRVAHSDDGVHGFARLATEYYQRYRLPLMLTETNHWDVARSPQWLWKMWIEAMRLLSDGVPLVGFCWYSLGDQMDWCTGLTQQNRAVNGCGLYDLDRRPNPVEAEFRHLLRDHASKAPIRPGLGGI
jgi:beta-glucosidase/6-phospho-beta-glucosidase/beta-galactosidase